MLRTTRNKELDQLVRKQETIGAEPLPKYLDKTKLRFRYRYSEVEALSGGAFIVAKRAEFSDEDIATVHSSVASSTRPYI